MDMEMISILLEEEGYGRKSKNGYAQHVYPRVCDSVNKKLKMDITVDNVRGRYRTLKDSYRDARKLEKTNSGFGWEASTERMSADPLCWAELLKTHPEYEKFLHKKVPYYDDLAIIVGDDEANGEDVVTGIEADKDMDQIEDIGISRTCDIGESCINLTDSPSTQVQEDTARGKEKSTKRRQRRGNNSAVESLAEAALRMASSMERPSIKDLQCELQKLDIGMELFLKAIDYLGRDAESAHIFLGLHDDLKVPWLDMVLK